MTTQAQAVPSKPQPTNGNISQENTATSPLVEHLQRQVGNAFVLYANYKHYHWQAYGPLFRDLHKLFDKLAREVLGSIDDFAERLRMIGQDPVYAPPDVVRVATMKVAAREGSVREMVAEADENAIRIIRELRDGAKLANDRDNPGTADLFARIVQIHERHEWFLREVLHDRDGLTERA